MAWKEPITKRTLFFFSKEGSYREECTGEECTSKTITLKNNLTQDRQESKVLKNWRQDLASCSPQVKIHAVLVLGSKSQISFCSTSHCTDYPEKTLSREDFQALRVAGCQDVR